MRAMLRRPTLHRWQIGSSGLTSAAPIAARCRRTCRASRSSSTSMTRPVRCSGELHRIGEDKSERLDIVPAQFRVLVTRRPKYACRACEDGVRQAPAPAHLIEGGMPTEVTIALWCPNMPTICRCTGRPRSMLARAASIWIDPRWRIGSVMLPGTCARCTNASSSSSSKCRGCSRTRRRCRCLIPAAAGPRPDNYGPCHR